MRVVIDMYIISIHHNVVRIAKKFRHLFKWNPLCFRKYEIDKNGSKPGDNDEDEVKPPANIRKCLIANQSVMDHTCRKEARETYCSRSLEVHQVCERNHGD